VPATTAEPDAWLRYAFRLQLLETLNRVGGIPAIATALKTAEGRDDTLDKVEQLCRQLWGVALGVSTASKSVELTASTAAATAAGELDGGGPATRFLVAAALCHDEPAERLRRAREAAAARIKAMDRDGRWRQYEAQVAEANASMAAQTQDSVHKISITRNHRALAALRAAVQREGRLMMIDDATALSSAVSTIVKSIGAPDAVKLGALAPDTDEAVGPDGRPVGDAMTRGLEWGRAANTHACLVARLRSLLARGGNQADSAKTEIIVNHVHVVRGQISSKAKAEGCTLGEAADRLAEELHPTKLPTLTPLLSRLLQAASTVALVDLGVPSLATQVSDVEADGIDQWTDPEVVARSVVSGEDMLPPMWASDGPPGLSGLQRKGRGTVAGGIELRGLTAIGSDDVSLALSCLACTGAAGTTAAARRAALVDADPGYSSKQLATLQQREFARAEVQAAMDSRKLRDVAAVIEQDRARAARDMEAARKKMLLQYHQSQEVLATTAEQVAALQRGLSGTADLALPEMPVPGANLAPAHGSGIWLGRGKRSRRSSRESGDKGDESSSDDEDDQDSAGSAQEEDPEEDDDDEEFVARRSRSSSKRTKTR
jgi:hypothetical protein